MKDEDDMIELGKLVTPGSTGLGMKMMLDLTQFNEEEDSFNAGERVHYTLAALDRLAQYLYGMPGRKNLLWLTGSFPFAILPDNDVKNPTKAARNFQQEVNRTAGLLAGARIAVYPLDARGLFPQPLTGPSISGGSVLRSVERTNAAASKQMSEEAEEQMSIEEVAHATGGRAIYNTNDLKGALAEVDRSGSRYYSLAYIPSDKSQDDKRRSIEVRVHPGKYHLEYRRSYFPVPTNKPDDTFRTLLQHNVPASTQIVFRLTPTLVGVQPANVTLVGSNAKAPRPVTRYTLAYDVDAAPLGLAAAKDGAMHGSTTMVTIAYDRDGRALNSVSNTLNLNVPSAKYSQFLKQGIQFRTQLDLPPQTAWLRAGIFDSSMLIGSLEIPIVVSASTPTIRAH